MTTNKILFLRNLNDEEPENWQKFWKSFNAWFGSDALKKISLRMNTYITIVAGMVEHMN